VLLIVLLIVLSVLFGRFQKGTQVKGLGPAAAAWHQAGAAPGRSLAGATDTRSSRAAGSWRSSGWDSTSDGP
jgi:hypothetical protein